MSKASFLILCSLAAVGHGIRHSTGRMEAGVMSFLIVCLLAIVTAVRRTAVRMEFGVTGKQFGRQWNESNQSSRSGEIALNEDEFGDTGKEVLEGTAVEVLEDTTGAHSPSFTVGILEGHGLSTLNTAKIVDITGVRSVENHTQYEPHEPCSNLHLTEERKNEALAMAKRMFNLTEGNRDVGPIVIDFLGTFGCNALYDFNPNWDEFNQSARPGFARALWPFWPYMECDTPSQFVRHTRCGCTPCAKFVREETKKGVKDWEFVMDGCCVPIGAPTCCQIL